MEDRLQIFTGTSNPQLAHDIASRLDLEVGQAIVSSFRDGETRVRLEDNVRGSDVFIVQSTSSPTDHHIMELLMMVDAARRASARKVTAVIPYYGYARQERKTTGREPISAKLVANLITVAGANRVVTVDLHAAAIEGFFDIPVDHLRAAPLLVEHFRQSRLDDVVVVSPDTGGVARANDFRQRLGASLAIIAKQRPRPDISEVMDMVGDVQGKVAVIVDDVITSGGTIANAAMMLRERGATHVYAVATHAAFSPQVLSVLESSCIERCLVTDTIRLPDDLRHERIELVSVASLIAEAINRIHKDLSVSAMFH